MKSIQLQDQILSAIIENCNFSLMEIGHCFKCLNRSFDALLTAIDKAREKGISLSRTVDIMELEQSHVEL